MGQLRKCVPYFDSLGARRVLMEKLGNFLRVRLFQRLPLMLQVLEGFDKRLSHALMGLLGASHNGKLLSLGYALMPILIVQPHTQHKCGSGLGIGRLGRWLWSIFTDAHNR